MLIAERKQQAVIRGGRLQLEIESPAEAFPQRTQTPCAIDARTEGCVDHELHPAGFVEESLRHDRGLAGHDPESALARAYVLDRLLGSPAVQGAFAFEKLDRAV